MHHSVTAFPMYGTWQSEQTRHHRAFPSLRTFQKSMPPDWKRAEKGGEIETAKQDDKDKHFSERPPFLPSHLGQLQSCLIVQGALCAKGGNPSTPLVKIKR